MSIRLMLGREPLTIVLYGYDPERDTLYAQVREVKLDGSDDFPILWMGLNNRVIRALTIATKLRPFADFTAEHVRQLETDRAEALSAPRGR